MKNSNLYLSDETNTYTFTTIVFCIGILAIALLIGHFHKIGNFGVETDFYGGFAPRAKDIMAGRPYTGQHHPPGYPLLLVGISLLTKDVFLSGKIISAFATAFFGWITFLLIKTLVNPRIAFFTTVLTLIVLLKYSYIAASDVVGALFIILPVWIILRKTIATHRSCIFAGIFAGFAYLIRSPGIFVIIGISFSLIFVLLREDVLKKRLLKTGTFIFGVFLIIGPWFLINWKTNRNPLANTAYLQIADHFYSPVGDRFGVSVSTMSNKFKSLSEVLMYNPLHVLWKYLKDVLFFNIKNLFDKGLGFPAYLFAGPGLLFFLRDSCKRKFSYLIINLSGYLLLGLVGFYVRYYFFLYPLLFLMVAYSLFDNNICELLKGMTRSKLHISYIIFSVLLLFMAFGTCYNIKKSLSTEPKYLIEISKFMKKQSSIGDKMISRKSHLAYLSGMEGYFPLCENYSCFLEAAKENRAKFLVYSDYEATLWHGLKDFANPEQLPKQFRLIYHHQPTNTLIYEIIF